MQVYTKINYYFDYMAHREEINKNILKEYFKDEIKSEIKILTQEEFVERHPLFKRIFTHSINRWNNQTIFYTRKHLDDGYEYDKILMYSDKHEYHITIRKDKYIGAGVRNRYTHVFETHHRGMDLSDGKYNVETMLNILADIVSYEVVKIDIDENCYQYNNIETNRNIFTFKCPHCGWEIKIEDVEQIDKLEELHLKIECRRCNKETIISNENIVPMIS